MHKLNDFKWLGFPEESNNCVAFVFVHCAGVFVNDIGHGFQTWIEQCYDVVFYTFLPPN